MNQLLRAILLEAPAVGLGLVIVMLPLHAAAMRVFGKKAMSHLWLAAQVFVAGALFHVLCEVTGLNRWYCRDRVDRGRGRPLGGAKPRV